ncbi:hypothetical protein C468_16782 [Halorubrum kocurii JCM 14978]|uniref:Uncharacterized protein n=2 Tax=Halorubrum kocurii TaxID=478441 RepID=M0NLW1_9EURY|nr:hypothetical protein C468_16782 [Halorubrum kocurii JCM 14978]
MLSMVGVGGSIGTAISADVALYHGRSLLAFAARIGTWLRIAGLLSFLLVLAWTGLIPGADLTIQLGTLSDEMGKLWSVILKP